GSLQIEGSTRFVAFLGLDGHRVHIEQTLVEARHALRVAGVELGPLNGARRFGECGAPQRLGVPEAESGALRVTGDHHLPLAANLDLLVGAATGLLDALADRT